MEVKQEEQNKKGMFYIQEHDKQQAIMTYSFSGAHTFVIEHTEVKPGNEGKGLGKLLVKAAVDFARRNGYKIIPVCPYAKSVFDKTEAYRDVLLDK